MICLLFDNQNICSGAMLYTCRAFGKETDRDAERHLPIDYKEPEIKQHQGGGNYGKYVQGCLYVLASIVPPDIRRAVPTRTERYPLSDGYTIPQRIVGNIMTGI